MANEFISNFKGKWPLIAPLSTSDRTLSSDGIVLVYIILSAVKVVFQGLSSRTPRKNCNLNHN